MSSENPEQPSIEPIEYQPPRLSILHLFFWTAGSSLVLAVSRFSNPGSEVPAGWALGPYLIIAVMHAMLYGAGLGSLGIAASQWYRGRRFPVQPGEWLLVIIGIRKLLEILFINLLEVTGLPDFLVPHTLMVIWLPIIACHVLLYCVAAYAVWKSRLWSWVFVIATIIQISQAILFTSFSIRVFAIHPLVLGRYQFIVAGVAIVICGLITVAAVLQDFRSKTHRGCLHWIGLSVSVGLLLTIAVGSPWRLFF